MKKTILLLTSSLVVASVSFLSIFLTNNIETSRAEEHGSSCVWNHYDAVEAKTGKHGSKEFWACCTHGTYVLEEPTSGQITDRGSFNGEYFDNLDNFDGRYVPQLGSTPILNGNSVTYGVYPQTNVNDLSLISSLNKLTTPESKGWYLYEDEYYAKVDATPYDTGYKFDNGTTIVSDTTYWFKCEPIVWNVLSNTNGEYYIVSSSLLDAHCYYNSTSTRTIDGQTVYLNNYKHSDIRAWLNDDFYNSAFALGNSHIQTTTVDNSAATTDSTSNIYACANTQDKVLLPSYQDYINSSYDFSTSTGSTETRYCKTTDWARARGAYRNTSASYLYNGIYWTRSPYSGQPTYVWIVDYGGYLYGTSANDTYVSVRPCLSIKIA